MILYGLNFTDMLQNNEFYYGLYNYLHLLLLILNTYGGTKRIELASVQGIPRGIPRIASALTEESLSR